MIVVGIYIKDSVTLEYNRVELFNDEKISVNSSIQNVNDITKTYSDYSQTFVVPASKQNNKIFRHWYENSNDNGFSTLTKADAYIEIDTIPFRSGKIQLESANVKDGQPQDYSITFIGALGSLKDKFNGLYLKDLDTNSSISYTYNATNVKNAVTTTTTSGIIMFPLISSNKYWNYGAGGTNDISVITTPIYYNELFPAVKLSTLFIIIANKFNINFNGTFLSDGRFTNAYLYLKNAEIFEFKTSSLIDLTTTTTNYNPLSTVNYSTDEIEIKWISSNYLGSTNTGGQIYFQLQIQCTVANIPYSILVYKDNILINTINKISSTSLIGPSGLAIWSAPISATNLQYEGNYTFKIESNQALTFYNTSIYSNYTDTALAYNFQSIYKQTSSQTLSTDLNLDNYMPDIKVEDFFSGILKMFNLTCYSTNGINYTIEQLESYYTSGQIIDITKYIKSDNVNLNRVKTYKKINFEYEKSDSLVNVGFNSANGIEYGSLFYNTNNDGDEYNIKLPFEDLNFNNLNGMLQVGYCLKTDLQKYIPKPVILYDYKPTALTTVPQFYLSTATSGSPYTSYKAFGQEYYDGTNTYGLNFNQQQSTLTNELIDKGLYDQYYKNYLTNIFDSKARLIKVSGILPTSLLTTLKLNDRLIIRDKRYLINTFTTDLTTGEVQFELLTDFRAL